MDWEAIKNPINVLFVWQGVLKALVQRHHHNKNITSQQSQSPCVYTISSRDIPPHYPVNLPYRVYWYIKYLFHISISWLALKGAVHIINYITDLFQSKIYSMDVLSTPLAMFFLAGQLTTANLSLPDPRVPDNPTFTTRPDPTRSRKITTCQGLILSQKF